ncbi:flagellar basal body-associated FliL family protein [Flindersiella endophytica]
MHQYTEVLSSEPGGNGKSNRNALIIGGIGLAVVLIAAIAGGVWWVNRDKDTPTASDDTTQQPSPQQTEPEQPRPTPEESLPNTPGPQRTQPPDEQKTPGPTNVPIAGRLTFTPLAKPWKSSDALGQDLLLSTAQTYTTEEKWDGESDWVALASAGYASPEWVGKDAKQTAGNIAEWFATSNFNNANVGRQPLGSSKIKVGEYDATLLKEHFSYNISGLKAKGETVSIVVVDIKGAPVPGVFLGSVPDTNKGLQKDVQKAIDSLKVES